MKEPYRCPEADRERVRKSEMTAIKMLITLLSVTANAKDDLADRLKRIPRGRWKIAAAFGLLYSVIEDVRGTIPKNQNLQIEGTINDYKVQVVPRAVPLSDNVVMTRSQAWELVRMAKDRCTACTEDGYSCRQCRLYKFLEATDPQEDYGSGISCPYSHVNYD